MRRIFLSCLYVCFFHTILNAQVFGGNPANVQWKQIQTPAAKIIFPMGLEKYAGRVADVVNKLDSTTISTIGNVHHPITIVLQNQSIFTNGYVALAPYRSEFYLTPDQDNFSLGSLAWADNLAIHEYRHVQQYNNFNEGFTKVFGILLGQQGRALANAIAVPDWFFEGDAVFQETLVSEQGRGRMASFLNDFKSLWSANKDYSWMKWRNGSLRNLVPDHYPLGYQLVAYGYQQYGTDFWKKVTNDAARFRGVFYAFNQSLAKNAGKSYRQFRDEAFTYFRNLSFTNKKETGDKIIFLSHAEKGNVTDYSYPQADSNRLVFIKKSYKKIPAFYWQEAGREHKIRVRDLVKDDHFSFNHHTIVYAAYNIDARWGYREYSDIRLIDTKTGVEKKLTNRCRYFSPDISADGAFVLAVQVSTDGTNELHLINSKTGMVERRVPNLHHYFFTQTKFLNDNQYAVAAVRDVQGKMALVNVKLSNGEAEALTPFSFNVIGSPNVKGDTVVFSKMENAADRIFAVVLSTKKIYRLTGNDNAFYQPAFNPNGDLVFTAATADGVQLAKINAGDIHWQLVDEASYADLKTIYTPSGLPLKMAGFLEKIPAGEYAVKKYRKGSGLFNFHSWRPYISEPEYGVTFYGDNILNTFTSNLYYTYNTNETSHTIGYAAAYGGLYPLISAGIEGGFNRMYFIEHPNNTVETKYFNSATLFTGISLPLQFVSGRTVKQITMGLNYNLEQRAEALPTKAILNNKSFDYLKWFFSFSNTNQGTRQSIYPKWAQRFAINYNDALTFQDNKKLLATAYLFLPGLANNHSIVLSGAYQHRDTLTDFFSNDFPFSRGYEARNSQTMYRLGFNYHFPIAYPDWGFASLVYFLRVRGNLFFDYTRTQLKRQTGLLFKECRTVGTEMYFDTKIWNELPVSIGVRYSRLLNDDALQPGKKNIWEIVLPLNLIPD